MPEREGGNVALFIDWDNLAISTAADHSGALPDLRRILQVAQSYGTVLVARAYAEWGVTSDRLTVFRAGIEPVYAPTFRFEADIPGQPSRGKSLADPCLVADCVDTLHLHPQIDTFVIVSGDKDLITIVRLAQLRGKKVVVIGPDLVAAVLKEMADEYVPYRSLVTGTGDGRAATVRAEAAELGRRRRRRRGRAGEGPTGAEPAPTEEVVEPGAGPEPQVVRHERRERRPFADRAGVLRPRTEAEPPAPEPAHPVEEAARDEPVRERAEPRLERAEPAAPAVPEAAEAAPAEPAPSAEGGRAEGDRAELFATISQILRERISAGRPRLRATNLKDYLIAKIPGFNERKFGFRQFRELLDAAEQAGVVQIADEGQVQWIAPPEAGAARTAPAAAPPTTAPPEAGPPLVSPAEAVAALVELRHRTPVLTQGVVNGALAGLAGARGAGERADDEARRILDQLVADGALRVDREPQEVELNGARHRVRLWHVVDDHPLVQQAESTLRQAAPAETAAAAEPTAEAPRSRRSRRGRGGRGAASTQAATAAQPAAEATPSEPAEPAPPAPASEPAQPEAPTGRRRDGRAEPGGAIPPEVLDALVAAVRESIPPDRDTAGAAGVKSRLTRALGTFDEGNFGFSKFKDFLQAAEKSGRVRVESAGAATRVGLAEDS